MMRFQAHIGIGINTIQIPINKLIAIGNKVIIWYQFSGINSLVLVYLY